MVEHYKGDDVWRLEALAEWADKLSAPKVLPWFWLNLNWVLVPHNGPFLFYIIQKLWSLFVFKFVEYVLIFQIVLFKIVICTQKRILNSILIDVSVWEQKDVL